MKSTTLSLIAGISGLILYILGLLSEPAEFDLPWIISVGVAVIFGGSIGTIHKVMVTLENAKNLSITLNSKGERR